MSISCTPSDLVEASKCYCFSQDMQNAVEIYLLCNIPVPEPFPVLACPEVPVELKAYYPCEDITGSHIIQDVYAERHAFGTNMDAFDQVLSGAGKNNQGIYAASHVASSTHATTLENYWGTNSFSIRFWMKVTETFSDGTITLGIAGGWFWRVWLSGAAYTVSIFYGGTWHYVGGAPGISYPLNEWHRICAWYCEPSGDIGIQLNNDPPVTDVLMSGLNATPNSFFITTGGGAGETGESYIDEIAVWSGVLTAAQRLDDWNGGAGKFYPDVPGIGGTIPNIATSTTLTSSKNPAALGDVVRLTASVSGFAVGGTVTFKEGVAVLGTVAWTGESDVYIDVPNFTVANHTLKAYYSGIGKHLSSESAPLSQDVVDPGTGGVWPDGPFYVDAATLVDLNAGVGDVTGVLVNQGGGQYSEIATYGGFQLTAGGGTWSLLAAWNTWGNTGNWVRNPPGVDPRGNYAWDSGNTFTNHPPNAIVISNTP